MIKNLLCIFAMSVFISDCGSRGPEDLDPFYAPTINVVPSNKIISRGDTLKITYVFNKNGLFQLDYISIDYFDTTGKLYVYLHEPIADRDLFEGGRYTWGKSMNDSLFTSTFVGDSIEVNLLYAQFNCDCNELHDTKTIIYLQK